MPHSCNFLFAKPLIFTYCNILGIDAHILKKKHLSIIKPIIGTKKGFDPYWAKLNKKEEWDRIKIVKTPTQPQLNST